MDRKIIVICVLAMVFAALVISGCAGAPVSPTVTPNVTATPKATVTPVPNTTSSMTNVSDVGAGGMANNTTGTSYMSGTITPVPGSQAGGMNNTTGAMPAGNQTMPGNTTT